MAAHELVLCASSVLVILLLQLNFEQVQCRLTSTVAHPTSGNLALTGLKILLETDNEQKLPQSHTRVGRWPDSKELVRKARLQSNSPPRAIPEQAPVGSTSINLIADQGSEVHEESASKTTVANEAVTESQSTFIAKVSSMLRRTVAPVLDYAHLINRYHIWYQRYRALEKATGHSIRRAKDVMEEEYSKADEQLFKELYSQFEHDQTDQEPIENVDFIYKTLTNTIERLEKRLVRDEQNTGIQVDDEVFYDTSDEAYDEERTRKAMERVKRISVALAKKILAQEVKSVAQIALFQTLVSYLKTVNLPDSFGPLAQIVCLLGDANTDLATAYLRDVQVRAAMAVIYSIGPLSLLKP